MHELKQAIAKISFAFADAIDSMDDHEFELLVQGKAKLRVIGHQEQKKAAKKLFGDLDLDVAVSELAQKLNSAESREIARDLLASINRPRKKDFLLLLAKTCSVSTTPKDSIARIEEKLIENVVGARLDSEAIKKVAF